MVKVEPDRPVDGSEKEPSDEEVLSYMRALVELIFEVRRETAHREKVFTQSEITDVST